MYKDINDKRLIKFDMFYDRRNIGIWTNILKDLYTMMFSLQTLQNQGITNQRNCI